MDEILIEDKKYISSKQAAKVTGYAKDYVGQLCREGRVPARLVGRSWYVLESAVHDHRFGNPKDEPAESSKSTFTRQSTWESPRYEASEAATLPSINRLHEGGESLETLEVANDGYTESEAAERLQETWQAWFDRFDTAPTQPVGAESVGVEEEKEEELEIEVPIHAIHHQQYQPSPREFLPVRAFQVEDVEEVQLSKSEVQNTQENEEIRSERGLTMMLQVAGFVVAVIAVSLATLGSGYLDKYIVSNSQVGLIAGVGLYNR